MLDFTISKEATDQTLISFLKKRLKTTPLSLIYKLFRAKKVKVAGKSIRYYHYRLKTGEKVIIYDNSLKLANPNSLLIPPQYNLDFQIIYQDKNIFIIGKDHGISMPELDKAVRYYFYQQNPSEYQELVQKYFIFTSLHRLDKLTQGLVIYPKNPVVKRILYNAINDKAKIIKKYWAICENQPKQQLPNYITGYLWKNQKEQKIEFSPHHKPEQAKYCAMTIKEASRNNKQLLLEVILHTGRKHQIRSILSFFGLPIVGDKKYGSKIEIKNKIYLFAYKIVFANLPSPLTYLNGQKFTMEKNSYVKKFI